MLKGLIALCILLGVIAMACWLVAPPIFATFAPFNESSIYQGSMMVTVLLPVVLFAFLGLVVVLKNRT